MRTKYKLLAAAAVLAIGCPVLFEALAFGAASDAQPEVSGSETVQAAPQNNMSGWTVPEPAAMPSDPAQAAQIKRGEYLVVAGDCLPCHSVTGQPPFSGGNALDSPVGAAYTPNITPSKRYGIGNYTDQQFWSVLHNGVAPGSSLLVFPHYLLPSMPYEAYSKLSYPDVMAIKAYLMSLPPAEIPNRVGQIPFPFDVRAAQLAWRMMFFHPQPMQYDASWSPQVRNGAFLVQALEHCSACHTPRNMLFASKMGEFLGGGHILAQTWYAPNITSDKVAGVGGWNAADLVQYLHGGGAVGVGAPVGPMQEVVGDSLSRLPESDVQDIAAYLQTGVGAQPAEEPVVAGAPVAEGAVVYADNCARCHGADGMGVSNNFPNLAKNQAFTGGPAYDVIGMVLGGFGAWHNGQSNMPAFRTVLSDEQIAAVANYVRTSWGNKGAADATADMVGSLRPVADSDITIDPGTTRAAWGGALGDVSGAFSRTGDQLNCTIDGTFAPAGGGDGIKLAGSCVNMGTEIQAMATVGGQDMAVTLKVRPDQMGQVTRGVTIYGPIGGKPFVAAINYETPNE